MAEPLTTTDIFRIRSGWGTGGDTAERQRWAAAGLSPATTEERERVRLGRGASALASPEAKAAMVAEEVRTGMRPASDLPEEYGGRPQITVGARYDEKGQPVGSFRRQLRMQEAWDARQSQLAEQQRIAEQLDLQQRQESRLQRDQDFELEKAKMLEDREARVQREAGLIVDSIRGATGPDGRIIARPIRPEDDNAIERLDNLARDFKLGVENKAAASMFSTLYDDALKYREDKLKRSQEQELAAINLSVQTGKPMKELGEYTEQGLFKPNVQGMLGAAEQVKTAEEKKAEEKAIATETRRAEAQAGVAEERNIVSQEREIQKGIRKATEDLRKMNAALAGKESLSERDQASLQTAKDTLIDLQIEKAALRNLVFESPEQYKSAVDAGNKPPAGTTIYIGRTPVKVK